MNWNELDRFNDRTVPKLHNLMLAQRAKVKVPTTVWARATNFAAAWPTQPPVIVVAQPCIVRSGPPMEDSLITSNAGQFLSVAVHDPCDFAQTVRDASILLREAGIPSIVNASHAFRQIANGDHLQIDPKTGLVTIIDLQSSD